MICSIEKKTFLEPALESIKNSFLFFLSSSFFFLFLHLVIDKRKQIVPYLLESKFTVFAFASLLWWEHKQELYEPSLSWINVCASKWWRHGCIDSVLWAYKAWKFCKYENVKLLKVDVQSKKLDLQKVNSTCFSFWISVLKEFYEAWVKLFWCFMLNYAG